MAIGDGGTGAPDDGGPGTDAAGRAAVVRGLASVALAAATEAAADDAPAGEDGEARARLTLIQVLRAHGTADPGVVAEAALEVARMVEEPGAGVGTGVGPGAVDADDEEPLEAAEAERVRRALGVPDPLEELAAALRAREWLERFAADLAR